MGREKNWRGTEARMPLGMDSKSKNLDCECGGEKVRKNRVIHIFYCDPIRIMV